MALANRNTNITNMALKPKNVLGTTGVLTRRALKENVNTGVAVGKKATVATRAMSGTQRSVLGNISNAPAQLPARQDAFEIYKEPKVNNHVAPFVEEAKVKEEMKQQVMRLAITAELPEPETQFEQMNISSTSQGEAYSRQLHDIDHDDQGNPQLVSEYACDIYDYMRELELQCPIRQHYMNGTPLNGRMRAILVDWLVQVHLRFKLLQETLFLTVSILDRFLQTTNVPRNKLQLVGVTSMLVASKYEEMYSPEVADFVYITDNAYSKADIRKMEISILESLNFQLGMPLALTFLRRFSKAGEVDAMKHTLAKYLMELTIIDYDMVHFAPSLIAAASLCLSNKLLDNSPWTDKLVYHSKYTEASLQPAMNHLCSLLVKEAVESKKLTAVRTKYQSSKFAKVSFLPELSTPVVTAMAAAHDSAVGSKSLASAN